MYEIRFLPAAERYFKKIREKPLLNAFREALTEISENPYAGSEKKGDLAGIYCWNLKYARTDYRIAYRIYEQNGRLVVVIMAGTHENFYQEIKNHIRSIAANT